MNSKTVGSSSHVQRYFSIVLAALALVGLTLFILSLQAAQGQDGRRETLRPSAVLDAKGKG